MEITGPHAGNDTAAGRFWSTLPAFPISRSGYDMTHGVICRMCRGPFRDSVLGHERSVVSHESSLSYHPCEVSVGYPRMHWTENMLRVLGEGNVPKADQHTLRLTRAP